MGLLRTPKTRQQIAESAYQRGQAASTGPATPSAIRKVALAELAAHRRLQPLFQSPDLCGVFIMQFMRGWYDAERARKEAAYQADLAHFRAALDALE